MLLDKARIAEAVEKRQRADNDVDGEHDQERDLRQQFRRLIDPGLVRPNSRETYIVSLNTLSTIAENLLSNPENDKYQRFKPTNSIIKRTLVEVHGALEYAIAMGFRAEVENFQPYYIHSRRCMRELRVGAAVLKEALERESRNAERAAQNMAREKEAHKGVAEKVKMNYLDDRKEKRIRDEMEKQRRQALARMTERDLQESKDASSRVTRHSPVPEQATTEASDRECISADQSFTSDDSSEES